MAIPHVGHGRDLKYGGNNAANSREIDMMPGNYKQMGDKNKDIAPVKMYNEAPVKALEDLKGNLGTGENQIDPESKFGKIVSGGGSKEGIAKMMDKTYGPATMSGPIKNVVEPTSKKLQRQNKRLNKAYDKMQGYRKTGEENLDFQRPLINEDGSKNPSGYSPELSRKNRLKYEKSKKKVLKIGEKIYGSDKQGWKMNL